VWGCAPQRVSLDKKEVNTTPSTGRIRSANTQSARGEVHAHLSLV
jgi:hypothetical protein